MEPVLPPAQLFAHPDAKFRATVSVVWSGCRLFLTLLCRIKYFRNSQMKMIDRRSSSLVTPRPVVKSIKKLCRGVSRLTQSERFNTFAIVAIVTGIPVISTSTSREIGARNENTQLYSGWQSFIFG
jgi:hypothetical protein